MHVRHAIAGLLCLGAAPVCGPARHPLSAAPRTVPMEPPALARGMSHAPRAAVRPVATEVSLMVTYDDGRLSVRAERTTLARLLQEVCRQTGLEVRGLVSLQQERTVMFADLPLLDGLRRLLSPVNYLLLSERAPHGGGQRVRAILVGHDPPTSFGPLAPEALGRDASTAEGLRQTVACRPLTLSAWRGRHSTRSGRRREAQGTRRDSQTGRCVPGGVAQNLRKLRRFPTL